MKDFIYNIHRHYNYYILQLLLYHYKQKKHKIVEECVKSEGVPGKDSKDGVKKFSRGGNKEVRITRRDNG